MFCPNCNQHYDSGKFCPECGTTLVDDAPASSGAAFGVGDYAAIEGGIHLSDSHNVHHEDRSVHNITNTTSTVTNITQVSAQKTAHELQQEHKTAYLTACKRAYEDNVLEQHEVVELEELRIKLSLDKETANSILEEVRVMSERNARKTVLNPIARTKLKILTSNLQKNEVRALMDQIDSLEPLVRKFDYDELSRKYFLVLAALKSEKCVEMYETSLIDSYWKSFWSYLAYIKQGQLAKAEDVLISLDRFSDYPEDNMSVLAVAGALMTGNALEAKEYLNELTGEYTPALQRFIDSLYLLLEPNTAKEMGADENTCAFYLVNFFGQKDPKAKAEEERLRQEAEEQARKKAEAEAEAKRKAEEEARKKAEAKRKAEEARKKAEAKRKAEEKAEAERKAKEEAVRKARHEAERKARHEAERKAKEEAERKAEEEAKRKAEAERKAAEKANVSGIFVKFEIDKLKDPSQEKIFLFSAKEQMNKIVDHIQSSYAKFNPIIYITDNSFQPMCLKCGQQFRIFDTYRYYKLSNYKEKDYIEEIMTNNAEVFNADGGKHKTNVQYQNGHGYVDLGLPSGTLWATCNIGASKPEDFGNYFAWGETTGYDEGKREFDDEHYKFLKKKRGLLGSKWIYTKYCDDKKYGIVDEKLFLDDEDDAAFVLWGKDWRMPTAEQVRELINKNNTSCKYVNQNGVNGLLITSKTNGNSIFLPEAGSQYYSYQMTFQTHQWEKSCSFYKESGEYWTKERPTGTFKDIHCDTAHPHCDSVFSLVFYISEIDILNDGPDGLCYRISENTTDFHCLHEPTRGRCFGYSIRPVRSK